MKKIILLLVISILLLSCSSKEEKIEKELANKPFNGVILVAKGDEVYYSGAYGYANKEQNVLNTIKTKFPIGSLTKQFTAACILLLQEDGLLNVSDPITKYIDYPTEEVITIHHLLSMSSGIPSNYKTDQFLQELGENDYSDVKLFKLFTSSKIDYSTDDLFKILPKKDSESTKAGVEFEYSNVNYAILGFIIDKVSGLSYKDFLSARIFKPLGMTNTGTDDYFPIKENTALGYTDFSFSEVESQCNLSMSYAYGDIFSTVEDLYKWSNALNSNFLSEYSKKEMFKTQTKINNNQSYGYGWFIYKNGEIVLHNGFIWGYRSIIYMNLAKDQLIITLTNTSHVTSLWDIEDLVVEILNE
ncbi:MAG: beta-lactamase family protein [Spirochaetaceae bacterium]